MALRSGAGGQPVPPLRDSARRAADSLRRPPHPLGGSGLGPGGLELTEEEWPGMYKLLLYPVSST